MADRAAETQAIKTELKRKGLPFDRVYRGRGTASCWITVKVPRYTTRAQEEAIEYTVAKVTDRLHWSDNCILVTWSSL